MNCKVNSLCENTECPVCFENVKLEKLDCSHMICESCMIKINNINSKCPICRSNFTIQKLSGNVDFKNYILNESIYQVTPIKYLSTFHSSCLDQNHKIKISKPYGIFLKCLDCGKSKAYNWLN